jgi:Do/DeqQ family serine protease
MKKTLGIILIASVTSFFTMGVAKNYFYPPLVFQQNGNEQNDIHLANYTEPYTSPDGGSGYVNLEDAAERSSKAVVHIKTETKARTVQYRNPFGDDFFDQFFGGGQRMYQQPQQSSGSGVIISADGYIVTNNHVVDGADNVTVILNNKKSYQAKVIGKDPSSDLAVLKIDESNLPSISYGNSDDVKLGQWVLAVGYPLTLETTVTAGIVSAKYRNIGINQSKSGNSAIESFIQTDAAVNPGNSGGALVNVNGDLVGINTAIASPTGSYAGYSFAVPSNIVNKVILDLKQFGISQRGFLGVTIKTVDDETAKSVGLEKPMGVYVEGVNKGSAGEEGGLKNKDVITKINGFTVNSSAELQEQVAKYRPADKIAVEFLRDGKIQTTSVQLKNKYNTTASVDNSKDILGSLGVTVENLSAKEKAQLGLESGVKVTDLKAGKLAEFTDIKKGFIITKIDDQPVSDATELVNMLKNKSGKVLIEGVYPNKPMSYLYAFRM